MEQGNVFGILGAAIFEEEVAGQKEAQVLLPGGSVVRISVPADLTSEEVETVVKQAQEHMKGI
ncbi:hypothetical protein [Streptomyces sp. WZ-12]|uniref:hypothetical protein n=1 Tax=Streptomyces sp. WZ-12 TaxID=3030210 RepID=UPI002380E140|nr:hypothetical protein [Streptomyces sp. WZ-12]